MPIPSDPGAMPAMVESSPMLPGLSPVHGKPIVARFDGGHLSSDGGLLALREIEQRLGMARRFAACIGDPRGLNLVIAQSSTGTRHTSPMPSRIYALVDNSCHRRCSRTPRHSPGSTSASPAISCGIRPPQPPVGAENSTSAAQEPPHDQVLEVFIHRVVLSNN